MLMLLPSGHQNVLLRRPARSPPTSDLFHLLIWISNEQPDSTHCHSSRLILVQTTSPSLWFKCWPSVVRWLALINLVSSISPTRAMFSKVLGPTTASNPQFHVLLTLALLYAVRS